jgi:hypothetical protein
MKRPFLVLLVLSCGLWFGCGQEPKTATAPDASKAAVTQKGHETEIKDKGAHGETAQVTGGESGAALPGGFPTDVPIYGGAKVTAGAKTKEMTTAILTTADPVKKVIDFYGEKLKANGWEIQNTMSAEEGGMVMATKGKTNCSVNAARRDGLTTVSLGLR